MLPILLSIPHGGSAVPDEIRDRVVITASDLFFDIDAYTREIYDLGDAVDSVHVAEVARTFVDLNRAPTDRPPANPDGVVKTVTCHHRPIYAKGLEIPDSLAEQLISRYHLPYHEALARAARRPRIRLAIDCHSMSKEPPVVSPDRGRARPLFCLSNGDGTTCEPDLLVAFGSAVAEAFECDPAEVRLNDPFKGGYITRHHGRDRLPWIQFEMNRVLYLESPWFDASTRRVDPDRLAELRQRFWSALSLLPVS